MTTSTTPERPDTHSSDKQVMSYKEFFILCISGPLLFFITTAIAIYFPKILSEDSALQTTSILQGVFALKFIFKRDPELNAEMAGKKYGVDAIRFLVVAATTVGSLIILVLPLYIVLRLIHP